MTEPTLLNLLWITALCGPIALLVLWLLDRLWRRDAPFDTPAAQADTDAHFLFRDDALIDQDRPWRSGPGSSGDGPETWQDLRRWLGDRFGTLPSSLQAAGTTGPEVFASIITGDDACLEISARRGARRVTLHDRTGTGALDRHIALRTDQSLSRHVEILDRVPCAVAMLDTDGALVWGNAAFMAFSEKHAAMICAARGDALPETRICLPGDGGEKDRHAQVSCTTAGDMTVIYATDVTQVAEAETVRREFIQTLTKTFANLTTGLAVFDKNRRLALFNPALLDLTDLPAGFLSAQPPLSQFFDRLRDERMLPEPRHYGTWRGKIDDMISCASDGRYQEDWHLVNGLTYRVTGRPHPDGAIAFLFEDISDELAMTRQIRTQLDIRQATLDTLDKAIAVIGADRSIVLCNRSCNDLLGIDPDGSFADMGFHDFLSACRDRLPQKRIWGEVETAVLNRRELERTFRTTEGTAYRCQVHRLPGRKVTVSIMPRAAGLSDQAPVQSLRA